MLRHEASVSLKGLDLRLLQGLEVFALLIAAINSVAAFGPLYTAYSIECWGTSIPMPLPTGQYTQLALGDLHACALTTANTVDCWGDNTNGQGGLASADSWKWIVAGYGVSCGLKTNGTARCYGLGDRTNASSTGVYYGLAMQAAFGCALTQPPGVIACWGVERHGEVSGTPTDGSSIQVATGLDHACKLNTSGAAYCWGNPADGRLRVPTGIHFTDVCAGSDMTCALQMDTGKPVCWGNAASLAGTPSDQSFTSLACGSTHVCGILTNESLLCWGNASSGALAAPTSPDRVYKQIAASRDYTCGLYTTPLTGGLASTIGAFVGLAVPSPALSLSPAPSSSSTLFSPSSLPSLSPLASASASAVPVVLPLTSNASASFSDTEPTIDLSASSSSGGAATSIAVRSSLQLVQVGNTSVPGLAWVATNATTTANGTTTGKTYEAQLDEVTNVTQAFSFNGANSTAASFSGLEFVIAAGSVKWSVNFTSSSSSSSSTQGGITLRYRLSDLAPSGNNDSSIKRANPSNELAVLRRANNTPRANMTSYFLLVPSSSSPAAPGSMLATAVMIVEVFDVALVDDAGFVAISHLVEVVNSSHYELVLAFPGFNRSLAYDPSIGLGVLLGSSGGGRGGGSDGTDVGLIVGVVVSISVAAIVVLAVITAAVALAVWKKRHQNANIDMVNFDQDGEEQL